MKTLHASQLSLCDGRLRVGLQDVVKNGEKELMFSYERLTPKANVYCSCFGLLEYFLLSHSTEAALEIAQRDVMTPAGCASYPHRE